MARKSGGKTVPDPLAVGPSTAVPPSRAQRDGSGGEPQEGNEVKYSQYCQQQDCQASTDNIFLGRHSVLNFGFCGKEEQGACV